MSARLLWLDFELTGLDFRRRDAVLEVAWAVTDLELNLLSDIRQRFTAWKPPVLGTWHAPLPNDSDWYSEEYGPIALVRDMHEQSGLREEWLTATYSEPKDVGQAIADDLTTVAVADEYALYLAGAGVSHFDQDVLGLHVPEFTRVEEGGRLHYRTFDVSVGGMVLDLPQKGDRDGLAALLTHRRIKRSRDWITRMDGEVDAISGGELDLAYVRPHRAADDVAVALAYARALRAWAA